eukprot:g5435.t1
MHDDSSSSSSSRSSSSEDEDEEASYKNGVDDRFGKKSMLKLPLMKDNGHGLRFAPVANTPNLHWQDGKKLVERLKKRNKSGTTMIDPEKYTGWEIQIARKGKNMHKRIGLKKYLPRNPNKKPEKADMERREAMYRSMGDAKSIPLLLVGCDLDSRKTSKFEQHMMRGALRLTQLCRPVSAFTQDMVKDKDLFLFGLAGTGI